MKNEMNNVSIAQWKIRTFGACFTLALAFILHALGWVGNVTLYFWACIPVILYWFDRNADDFRANLIAHTLGEGIGMGQLELREHVQSLTGLMKRTLERIENAKDKNEIETMRKHALQWQLDGQEQVRGMVHELKDKAGNVVCRFEWSRKANSWVVITPPVFLEMKVDATELMKSLNDIKAALEHVEETTHALRDVNGPHWDKPVMPHVDPGSAPQPLPGLTSHCEVCGKWTPCACD